MVLAGGLIFGAWLFWTTSNDQSSAERAYEAAGGGEATMTIPSLSAAGALGRDIFNARCAACHGADAMGGTGGPPLIHEVYEPSHHADPSFHLAVRNGVRAHHWGFGDMPPQPGVTAADVDRIIAFVRETQRANGIN